MRSLSILFVCLAIIGISACDSDEKNARLQVWLTDAPGDYEAVNVDIRSVEVHVGEGDEDAGWKVLAINEGIYNLLDLTNGLDTLLGEVELPPGKISQIRLKLGDQNTVKINDQLIDLKTPSAQQSGLKIQVNETLLEGIVYKVLLDFDAARSIVHTGNDKYILKPVIRSISEAQSGAIRGTISPVESTPAIYAIMNLDTLGTTFADETGNFLIKGLPGGTYTVVFVPQTGYVTTEKPGVNVSVGAVTDLEAVSIPPL